MHFRSHFLLRLLLVALVSFATPNVRAVTPADDSQTALQVGHEALKAFERGDYERAFSGFQRAEQLAHSPVFLLYQARSAILVGRYVLAEQLLRSCSGETLDASSPQAWVQAALDARRERQLLAALAPRLALSFAGEVDFPVDWALYVLPKDDEPAEPVRQGRLDDADSEVMIVDPGPYRLWVRDRKGRSDERALRTRPGRLTQVQLRLIEPARVAPRYVPLQASTPTHPPSYRAGAWTALGSGGVLTFASLVAGGVAFDLARKVKAHCLSGTCPFDEYGRAQQARSWGRVATATFVGGMIGLASGVTLWISDPANKAPVAVAIQGPGVELSASF